MWSRIDTMYVFGHVSDLYITIHVLLFLWQLISSSWYEARRTSLTIWKKPNHVFLLNVVSWEIQQEVRLDFLLVRVFLYRPECVLLKTPMSTREIEWVDKGKIQPCKKGRSKNCGSIHFPQIKQHKLRLSCRWTDTGDYFAASLLLYCL